jgi:hypothetical protein
MGTMVDEQTGDCCRVELEFVRNEPDRRKPIERVESTRNVTGYFRAINRRDWSRDRKTGATLLLMLDDGRRFRFWSYKSNGAFTIAPEILLP